MVEFHDLVGVAIAPVSKKLAVEAQITAVLSCGSERKKLHDLHPVLIP